MPRFKLLAGQHTQNEPDGKERTYSKGDVVESKANLAAKFGKDKFELLHDYAKEPEAPPINQPSVAQQADTLDAMTEQEIVQFAAEEEIDLKGAKTRADKIKVIRAAVK